MVGYGNDLRSDDGAGRHVARAIANLRLKDVLVESVHQLTPELAADLAGRRVIFVDAAIGADDVAVRRLSVGTDPWTTTHTLTCETLVSLAVGIGHVPVDAVVVTVPAVDLSVGDALSPVTQAAVEQAVGRILELIS